MNSLTPSTQGGRAKRSRLRIALTVAFTAMAFACALLFLVRDETMDNSSLLADLVVLVGGLSFGAAAVAVGVWPAARRDATQE